jgi:hypothetical protein
VRYTAAAWGPCNTVHDFYLDPLQFSAVEYCSSPQYEPSQYPIAPLLEPTLENPEVPNAVGWHHDRLLLSPQTSDVPDLCEREMSILDRANISEEEMFLVLQRLNPDPEMTWEKISILYKEQFDDPVKSGALTMRFQRLKKNNSFVKSLFPSGVKRGRKGRRKRRS